MTPRPGGSLLVLAHSSPALERAHRLFGDRPATEIVHCGPGRPGIARAVRALVERRPAALYLVDVGASTTVAAVAARVMRRRVALDTGDLVFALERSLGKRSRASLMLVWAGEKLAVAAAQRVIVRGRRHRDFVRGPTVFAPDLAPAWARPTSGDAVRCGLGLEETFVVGVVGSVNRAPRLGITYGWDLVEALALTGPTVSGLIVGDGEGLVDLHARARRLGVEDRCRFAGRIEGPDLADYIGAMDVALSTQTNDAVGAVRTTGKLPLYLACGRPILATDVGEARLLFGGLGWTIRYDGVVDQEYPARLAERILEWSRDPAGQDSRRQRALSLSELHFNADRVRAEVWSAVDALMAGA